MSNSKHILIVDDEPNVLLVFRTALAPTGHEVETAAEGQEALEKLATFRADLVLLDLQMPVLGGMETLRRLRQAGNDVPVVIVTAYGSIPDAVEAMKLGAIDFLSKPLTPEALRTVVADVLERYARPEPRTELRHVETIEPQPQGPAVAVLTYAVLDLSAAKKALTRRDFDTALDILEEAIEHYPTSPEAHTLLGVLYECRGQDNAAFHCYKKALTLDGRFQPALDNLQRYCTKHRLDLANPAINPAAAHARATPGLAQHGER